MTSCCVTQQCRCNHPVATRFPLIRKSLWKTRKGLWQPISHLSSFGKVRNESAALYLELGLEKSHPRKQQVHRHHACITQFNRIPIHLAETIGGNGGEALHFNLVPRHLSGERRGKKDCPNFPLTLFFICSM
jgi:hypothetical protein